MKIADALNSLENSWSRDEVLKKIKNGASSEKIINDFINTKNKEIETLVTFINPKENLLLSELEELSKIESKLINKIKNYNLNKNFPKAEKRKLKTMKPERTESFDLRNFMMKWSNKFVFIFLLVISAIALSKQAWV